MWPESYAAPALPLALIHRSEWKVNSLKYRLLSIEESIGKLHTSERISRWAPPRVYTAEADTLEEGGCEAVGIISWIVVGLIAGLLAKLLVPGDDPGGIIVTILIGMVGAVIGGLIVGLLGGTGVTGFNVWSILVATLGAIILLALLRLVGSRTT